MWEPRKSDSSFPYTPTTVEVVLEVVEPPETGVPAHGHLADSAVGSGALQLPVDDAAASARVGPRCVSQFALQSPFGHLAVLELVLGKGLGLLIFLFSTFLFSTFLFSLSNQLEELLNELLFGVLVEQLGVLLRGTLVENGAVHQGELQEQVEDGTSGPGFGPHVPMAALPVTLQVV